MGRRPAHFTAEHPASRFLRRGPLLISLGAAMAVIVTLGPSGSGPGVTCDEPYHVAQGKRLVAALGEQGLGFFLPENIRRNFPWHDGGPPVQGPLGHWILGTVHRAFDPAPDEPGAISVAGARFAPAICFGFTVLLVGLWTEGIAGLLAGTVAAAAVALSPRLFAHAHLASLDTITTLFFVAALAAVAKAARGTGGAKTWQFAAAGAVWGLAVLVRLHGLLLVPPVAAWLVWRFRKRAWLPLLLWFSAGAAVVFVLWPWLWLAPWEHSWKYVASGTDRQPLHLFYLGQVWADRDVPWHYPSVMFLLTVPLGLLLLGALGLWAKRPRGRDNRSDKGRHARTRADSGAANGGELALAAGTLLWVLLVFSWPGVPVYDGVRLFLVVFPLWAIAVGVGARWLVELPTLAARRSRTARLVGLSVLVVGQGLGTLVYHPCQLSYYNLLAGGLWGASHLGFEVSYWGDAVGEPMLAEAAARSGGGPILFAPSLAGYQVAGVNLSSPALVKDRLELVGFDRRRPERAQACRVAVVYHRRADPEPVAWVLREGQVVSEYSIQGVWLSRVVALPNKKGTGAYIRWFGMAPGAEFAQIPQYRRLSPFSVIAPNRGDPAPRRTDPRD